MDTVDNDHREAAELDVGAVMGQLRAEVRAAHGLLGDASPHLALGVDMAALAESIAEVEALRAVSVHWPLVSHTPRQRAEVVVQRVLRRALRFYLEPIVEQQNRYNAAVARAIALLHQAQQGLADDIGRLRKEAGGEVNGDDKG